MTTADALVQARGDLYEVTMVNPYLDPVSGEVGRQVLVDRVPEAILEAYVADARTRHQFVGVSEEPVGSADDPEVEVVIPDHLTDDAGVLRDPAEFAAYGDATSPQNALDEALIARGESPSYAVLTGQAPGGLAVSGGTGGGGGSASTGLMARALLGPLGFLLAFMVTMAVVVTQLRLAIQTTIEKNASVSSYTGRMTHAALFSTVPGASAGTELTGGTPAYARKALSWGGASGGVQTATAVTFDVAAGSTVAGAGLYDAISAGNYRDGGSVTSQAFASQGTYQLTVTATFT